MKNRKQQPVISIVIPLYIKTPDFFEAVEKCLELDYGNFETLIGVDNKAKLRFKDKRVKLLKTGEVRTGPAEKRDIGIVKSKADYIAFLDDDSYPAKDWLKQAVKILQKRKVAAVCGPGLTPPADGFAQKLSGAVLASPFGSGPYYYRFVKGKPRYVDDYPAYNMIVDKRILKKVGGFGTKFYGGEDTALCLKIINSGEKIYYHPDIVVYHHRRRFPFEFVKQVGNVGLHRGYFVKKYPSTSLRPSYFGPAILTIGFPVLILWTFLNSSVFYTVTAIALFFYIVVFLEALSRNTFVINLILPFAIVLNYFVYGVNFLKGLFFTRGLER